MRGNAERNVSLDCGRLRAPELNFPQHLKKCPHAHGQNVPRSPTPRKHPPNERGMAGERRYGSFPYYYWWGERDAAWRRLRSKFCLWVFQLNCSAPRFSFLMFPYFLILLRATELNFPKLRKKCPAHRQNKLTVLSKALTEGRPFPAGMAGVPLAWIEPYPGPYGKNLRKCQKFISVRIPLKLADCNFCRFRCVCAVDCFFNPL